MATDTNETGTDDQKDDGARGEDNKSQAEMTADFEAEQEKQYAESRRKIGVYQVAATIVLIIIALGCFYLGSSVNGGPGHPNVKHPLVENALYLLGALNLLAALAIQIRKNFSRTFVLILMPTTMAGVVITFTNTTKGALLVALVCVVEIVLMFRQPVLDEYDAPKE